MPLYEEGKPNPEGLQLWIDLPAKDKNIEPLYQEMLAKEWVSEFLLVLHVLTEGSSITTVRPSSDVEITVISGESHGEKVSSESSNSGPVDWSKVGEWQGVVRPVGGCWYLDFKLKAKGAKVFQPLPKGWTSFIYRTFPIQSTRTIAHSFYLVLSGGLTVGEEPAVQKAYHTLVLSANEGEDGVWLESTEDGLTRGVLIAGEPLQQPVVQVSPLKRTRQAVTDSS
jgi:redox-sensitive bicupin YhaK (pirin superfamily)